MTTPEILSQLKSLGSEQTRNILLKHGAKDPCYGVKVEDLKKILKKVGQNNTIAFELFDSGVYDALYLAGLIGNGATMTEKDLHRLANLKYGGGISEYTIPWLATEHPKGWDLALEWIDSKHDAVSSSGWATLSTIVSVKPDTALDVKALSQLLKRVAKEIQSAPNRTRHAMNGFVIAVGCYVPALTAEALNTAKSMGPVTVDMNGTACKVPVVAEYIKKVEAKGAIGKKRKNIKC